MRWLLAAILIVFAALQYNDPDAILWIAIYLIAAAWCVIAALRPGLLSTPPLLWLALASGALYALGFVWLVRDYNAEFLSRTMMAPGVETTREAFGLLICALVTAWLVWADGRGLRRAAAAR